MDVTSAFGSQNSIYYLVDQYMRIESIPRDRLLQQKDQLSSRKNIYSNLHKALSALQTKIKYLNDTVLNRFAAKEASSSDSGKLGVSAEFTAVTGSHSISVERLAQSDTRVSDQYITTESSFSSFTTDQTFTIEVVHPTEDDPDNRVAIEVTVEAAVFSESNDHVLNAIAEAINEAMVQAIDDETINRDEAVNAALVMEQTGTSRLLIRSEQSGYTYRMDFGSSALLDALNINADTQSSGTSGGYITYVGSSVSDSELNSKFVMNGLTFYRDSNTVDDALNGVTFRLLTTFDETVTATISTDIEAVQKDVQEFLDKYNEVIGFLRENTRVNSETKKRGILSTDIIYSGMISDLRNAFIGSVSTTTSDEYTMLYNIGIETDKEGKLSIKDVDKFRRALESKTTNVSDLFNSEDGISTRLQAYLDRFVKTNGTIDNSKKSVDNQMNNLQDRIKYMNELLAKKEKYYFEEFAKIQEAMYILQNQQAFFSAFSQSIFGE